MIILGALVALLKARDGLLQWALATKVVEQSQAIPSLLHAIKGQPSACTSHPWDNCNWRQILGEVSDVRTPGQRKGNAHCPEPAQKLCAAQD